jgi:hypothetical protein
MDADDSSNGLSSSDSGAVLVSDVSSDMLFALL